MIEISNKSLCFELIISKAQGKLTDNIIEIFKVMCLLFSENIKYYSNDDKIDCYHFAMCDIFKKWIYFDVEKYTDAFSFFYYLIKRSFLGYYPVINKNSCYNIKLTPISVDGLYSI